MDNLSKTFSRMGIMLFVLLAISFFAAPAQAKYGGGTGEPNDPYLIFDANQMNAIGADVNAKTGNDGTPLHRAAEKGQIDVVEILPANSADVNAKDNQGQTALWHAEQRGHTQIISLLRKHGAKE